MWLGPVSWLVLSRLLYLTSTEFICRKCAEISHILCYHLGDFRLEGSIGILNLPRC
jgi:hypothetical protein